MGIAKRLNLVMVSAFALLLGCLMFTSLDTAWGAMYQEGDVWIGTDGEQMTPEEAGQWEYNYTNYGAECNISKYTGGIVDGEIIGCVPATINDSPVTSMSNTFSSCTSLVTAPEIPDSVTDMYSTFKKCILLVTAPDIPGSVTGMWSTFEECISLVNAPVIPDGVTDMHSTFEGCTSLVNAPAIPNGVTDIRNTFERCESLVNAPVIPDGVTDMTSTFEGCTSLVKAPDVPDSVTDMNNTFAWCTSLVNAPAIPNGVTDMGGTFGYCTSLVNTPEIPDSVIDMTSTFYRCRKLKTPPIIPDSVEIMDHCFDYCNALYGEVFIPDSVTSAEGLFCGCTDNEITVQYTPNNTVIPGESFTPNITKEEVPSRPAVTDPSPDEGEDEEQDPTTPSNPGETSGNMSIYGTVQPITMIDVTVPLTIQFTIESDRTFTGPDSIKIKSNCPSPLDVNLYGVNKDGSAPSLVAPDTHSDDEWNNLSRAETLASIALMLDNTSLSSTGSTLGRIDSAFQSEKALDLDLSAKYGKAWDNSEDLVFTYNVVFEFAMP